MKSTRYTEKQIIRILGGGRVGQGSGHRMPTIQRVGSHGTSLARKGCSTLARMDPLAFCARAAELPGSSFCRCPGYARFDREGYGKANA